MGFSNSAKDLILSSLTGRAQQITIASSCYIGVGTVGSGVFFENKSVGGYKRTLIGYYNGGEDSKCMGIPSEGKITNEKIIYLPEATGDWGIITHFAFYNSATGTDPVFVGELSTPIEITTGYVPIFRVGTLSITIV